MITASHSCPYVWSLLVVRGCVTLYGCDARFSYTARPGELGPDILAAVRSALMAASALCEIVRGCSFRAIR